MDEQVALITGAAKRIGAVIAETLHQRGMNIVIHYHHSKLEAEKLCSKLNSKRANSATLIEGNLSQVNDCSTIIETAQRHWGRLDALINNASSFYPTQIGSIDENAWDDLLGSNLKGPIFLSQRAAPFLKQHHGNIINIVDIHADRPLKNHTVYCCAKAGLVMLTKSLARELSPEIRVNAIAPGAILWPNEGNDLPETAKTHILERTLLKRLGKPQDIADAILYMLNATYVTGQVLAIDGGRTIKD
jgi:pteridine reductase